ncbi:MAG: ABC transporter ATP-binding protein [Flavobacteriales bacterium]|jgi:subfamily B ATP-binding cassette protein MsbA|nr:ABC transporter ATP-binding protein [Flavobacteriales bacterium]MBK6550052.1 ABC transporter ATP-binding protein [Flavobacteriales bacterium]MBK6881784.1 ABC transporter ATP-binding protein [Flavobacteriales bacterium]MBK7102563.1 ABC transporter ATP-binding protein [Flavobacteriales bacterium]MBK7113296.1 ABC transporter ATP-binding protein [Flavobacteriales bacterium]
MRNFFRILRFGKPYRHHAVLNVVFNLLATLFHLSSLLLFIPFLRLLLGQVRPVHVRPDALWTREGLEGTFNWGLTQLIERNGQMGALLGISIAVVVIFLFKNFFRYLAVVAICNFRNYIVRDIRAAVYSKMLELPLRYHSGERKGDLLALITNDMHVIEYSVMFYIEMVFREPIAILLFLGTMITIAPQLTLVALLLLPISGFLIARISKSLKRKSTRVQEKSADLLARVEETLTGIRVIKAFNGEVDMKRRFDRENEMLTRSSIAMLNRQDIASPLSETMGAAVMAAIAYLGGYYVLGPEATLTGDSFLGFIIIFSQLLPPIKGFSQGYSAIVRGSASGQRLFDLLAVENTVKERPDAKRIEAFIDRVEFRNVSFTYDTVPVLQDIQLVIPKGKSVALVGTSGSGKTTMAGLLPRFFDVAGGQVLLDDQDIRDLRINDLRALMGIVTQDSILFNDTVANNIAFGTPGVAVADIERAARIANAHDFILQLEDGYQTNIGDGGNRLSGGQKQRIGIARAVLKNPAILILDEATSALDTESERLVQDALVKMLEGRTSLVIAHRLSTIQHCDEICVMQQGRIIERGTHQQLYDAGGQYRKLCDMQAFA